LISASPNQKQIKDVDCGMKYKIWNILGSFDYDNKFVILAGN